MAKILMIVDTDGGVDDILAILLALHEKDSWEILAFTGVFGNTKVDHVCGNVMKVLKLWNKTQIPVYRGCEGALVWKTPVSQVFGEDGIGDVGHNFVSSDVKIAKGHAVNALVDLARAHREKDLHLVALGPLTNIAMAHRMDPQFTANLKSLVLMGGNCEGIGNTTSAAEFNFFCDPEAAHVVLSEARCPLSMVPWEAAERNLMPWDLYEQLMQKDSEKGRFFKIVTAIVEKKDKAKGRKGFMDCDLLAVASLIQPGCVKTKLTYPVSVETEGKFTRGQAVIERRMNVANSGRNTVDIITEFHESPLNVLRRSLLD